MANETAPQRTTSDSIAAVPTLHSMSTPLLTQPADIMAYLINIMFANPGNTSTTHRDEMISFRQMMAEHSQSPDALAETISQKLTAAITRYFPNDGYQAICTVNRLDGVGEDGAYLGSHEITLSFVDRNSIAVVPRSKFEVDAEGALIVHYGEGKRN